ncbi:hypothetical protein AVEN_174384-1 [Araneus ventricosus]|uniref:Uncharacterized protein n=1 Tax=Araneus ventricosus TaxID=182803 RepID=A0A4Y2S977_ARAVE|nr:hypothetical protein AVEN_174384-1 [Araneus ventricosus]
MHRWNEPDCFIPAEATWSRTLTPVMHRWNEPDCFIPADCALVRYVLWRTVNLASRDQENIDNIYLGSYASNGKGNAHSYSDDQVIEIWQPTYSGVGVDLGFSFVV